MPENRRLFLVFGSSVNWAKGKQEQTWGFPPVADWEAALRVAGFGRGAEFLACVGPKALFRGRVTSDGAYFDDRTAPWGRDAAHGHVWPVRFRFEVLQEIDQPWFIGPSGRHEFRTVLENLLAWSLCTLREDAVDSPYLRRDIVFGSENGPPSVEPLLRHMLPVLGQRFDPSQLTTPEDLEDAVAELFSLMGFKVTTLGHTRPMERCPDGVALLPPSLVWYYEQRARRSTFFILWDCKFRVEGSGLRAEEERKAREYAADYAERVKTKEGISNYWFLLVGKDSGDAEAMRGLAQRLSSDVDLQRRGCLGVRAVSYEWLRAQVEELAMGPREEGIRGLEDRIRKL